MPTIIEGKLSAQGKRFAVVVSRFNDFITDKLLGGTVDALVRTGALDADIHVVKVPGAFEIPLAAQRLAKAGRYDAVICLGAVIRGATPHFDYVSAEVSKGIAQVGLESGTPVIFGILTTDTVEQAIERAGTKAGNKGWSAAHHRRGDGQPHGDGRPGLNGPWAAVHRATASARLAGAQNGNDMGNRRRSRELALQALFFMDLREDDSEEKLALFVDNQGPAAKAQPFFMELVRGVMDAKPRIDEIIERFASNWKISRMSGVDRNILRIAVFEMLVREDIPVKVAINEAIDIGKKYGTEESGAFINGILDSIHLAAEAGDLRIASEPELPRRKPDPLPDRREQTAPPAPEKPGFAPVRGGKRGVVKRRTDIPV